MPQTERHGARQFHTSANGIPTLPDRAPIRVIRVDADGTKIYSRPIPYVPAMRAVVKLGTDGMPYIAKYKRAGYGGGNPKGKRRGTYRLGARMGR